MGTKDLEAFLKQVEKRSFKMAFFATRDEDAALDIVQEAMTKLCENYSRKDASDYPALFGRILQNCINDHFRKSQALSRINLLYEDFSTQDGEEVDFLAAVADESAQERPQEMADRKQTIAAIEEALESLPERQRQAFLLRHWEGLDTDEAAQAMNVSAGSVKTHLSRATKALASMLAAKGLKI